MLTADAILHGDRDRLMGFDASEQPVVLQLGGSDPAKLSEAARIGAEINWLCVENREVVVANTHAGEILRRQFVQEGLARRYVYYTAALRELSGLSPVWSGFAGGESSSPQPQLLSASKARELWVFRPDSTGGVDWWIAAVKEQDQWNLTLPLEPGGLGEASLPAERRRTSSWRTRPCFSSTSSNNWTTTLRCRFSSDSRVRMIRACWGYRLKDQVRAAGPHLDRFIANTFLWATFIFVNS